MIIRLTIPGEPRTKKNSQRIIPMGKGYRLLPSKAYVDYEKEAKYYLMRAPKGIDCPVNVRCVYFMKTRRKVDLVNLLEATCDILVKHGVLTDDNSKIVVSHDGSYVDYDKNNPRVVIEIERVEDDTEGSLD
jgi:Holliday junction resolvase RusA-like endonuclease